MALTYTARRGEYAALWVGAVIRPERKAEVTAAARLIIANKERYASVEMQTNVPWYVIGIIHTLESSGSFTKHLHNGDPLIVRGQYAKTIRAPAGRGPFETWEISAVDALRYDGLHNNADWSIERTAWILEKFNGMGYAMRGLPSPYLWSFTTAYRRGKFIEVRSGSRYVSKYMPDLVSVQCGGMAILKALIELGAVEIEEQPRSEIISPKAAPPSRPAIPEVAARSKSVWALVSALALAGFEKLKGFIELLPAIQTDVDAALNPINALTTALGASIASSIPWIVGGLIVVAICRHTRNRS